MPELKYINDDPRYELVAALLPGEGENLPDAEQILEDLLEILRLCYTYTLDHKWSASDLAEAIASYLQGQWAYGAPGFAEYAEAYWTPSTVDGAPIALDD